ncbi:MAG TPA: ABC transporter substrate-binding protein [Mariprofundaceae bacterium]|nr:ABC transporter substrate-binding protein [Mariprofundaceae bacterium]
MIRAAWVTVLLLLSCHAGSAQPDQLLRVGMAQMPISLDPRYATDASSMHIQQFLHRGLVHLDEHFEVQPDLAVRWEHPSQLQWRFWLRPGIHFHDGSVLSSADVVATLRGILSNKLASPLKGGFAAVERVEAQGEDQVLITLNKPDASLLTRLNVGILPEALAMAPQRARNTIGCGPYRLVRWQSNELDLARVQPDVDKQAVNHIRFVEVKDPVTRMLKIARGELDFIQNDLPPYLLPYLRRQPAIHIQTRPSTTFSYIGLNLHDRFLQDVRVRQALALALDRDQLKRALFADLPELAETVLTPDHWAAAKLPVDRFDPGRATELLDQAGFPANAEGVRFSLTYRTSTDPTRIRLATAIASMWEKIGIKVSVESLEWGGFYARIKSGDFQVFSLSWVGISDPDIYRWILHSSMWPPSGANRGRYSNKQVDDWLDRASASQNQLERQRLYGLVQRKMHDDMVYIPLWYEPVIAVSGPRIHGFRPQADGSLFGLSQASLEDGRQ